MRAEFEGKTALVTGAAQGIGRAIADRLASSGARVIYTDRDGQAAEAAAKAAAQNNSVPHLAYALDVTDRNGIDATLKAAVSATHRIDILINNAGIGVKASDRQTVEKMGGSPVEVDETASNAKYENGVLELTLVKKAASAGRKLTIQ